MTTFREHMKKARNEVKNDTSSSRFREIVSLLKRYDLKEGLTPEMTVELLEDMGPTFVKLGQIASTHPDILPKEYCDAFAKLRANARPMPAETVRSQVEQELGKPIEELFSAFDETAVGSASIAQVHRAVLKSDGTEVACKVQRPHVAETVAKDLALMEHAVDFLGFFDKSERMISVKELVAELERTSHEELDFTTEAQNLERFYQNNENRDRTTSPRYFSDYSTTAVLTEDFASSPRVGLIETLGLSDEQREDLGYLIARNYVAQVLEDGFFHADPHAGNILITGLNTTDEPSSAKNDARAIDALNTTPPADAGTDFTDAETLTSDNLPDAVIGAAGDVLVKTSHLQDSDSAPSEAESSKSSEATLGIEWIDFGMMGTLTTHERDVLEDLVMAIAKGDAYKLKRSVLRVATPKGVVDHGELLEMCEQMVDEYVNSDLESFNTGELLSTMVSMLQDSEYELSPFLVTLGRGLVTLEGTIRMISPKINIMSVISEYLSAHMLDPGRIQNEIRKFAGDSADSFEAMASLPSKAASTLDMLQKGQLKVGGKLDIDSKIAGNLSRTLDNFSLVIIAAALFLGSSILCLTGMNPQILGVPTLGFAGFVFGIVLMIYVCIRIARSGKR